MTRLTRKEKSLSMAVILFLLALLAIALSSCGPSFYLKKAERALKKAEQLGADISADTIWVQSHSLRLCGHRGHYQDYCGMEDIVAYTCFALLFSGIMTLLIGLLRQKK